MNGLDRWSQYNYFWDVIAPTLRPTARLVWLAVFRHADTYGRSCVTRSRLAAMLDTTKKTVSDGIKELKDRRLIEKINGEYGYKITLTSNADVTPPSNENVTHSNATVTPPVTLQLPPSNENVTTPVTKTLHNTEQYYRTDIQNRNTDTNVEKPKKQKQAKLPKTQKQDWKAKASSTFLFEAMKLYPAHRRTYKPKEFQAIWDNAANEEGGYEVLWNIVRQHLENAVTSTDWTKEYGKFVPSMENYIGKRKYRAPVMVDEISEAIKKAQDDCDGIPF